ncbi:MAG: TlpA family protein disulfide reductase [Lysinibacillus sp.]
MEYFSIGSINIPISWIAFFIAAVSLDWIGRKLDDSYKKSLDTLFWLYIFIWKGSYVLFFWDAFIQAPMSLLYFDGGVKGHIASILVLSMYVWKQRQSLSIPAMWQLWLRFLAIYQVVFTLFTQQWLLAALWILLLVVGTWKGHQLIWFLQVLLLIWQYTWSDGIFISFGVFLLLKVVISEQAQQKQFIALGFIAGLIGILLGDLQLDRKREATEMTEISLETTTGEVYDVQERGNNITIVNFFATWCPPCKAEMPHLQSFAERLPENVALIGVNLTARDDGEEALSTFIEQYNVTYPILLDDTDRAGTDFKVLTIPTTVILDKDGREVERIVGPVSEDVLHKMVERYTDSP